MDITTIQAIIDSGYRTSKCIALVGDTDIRHSKSGVSSTEGNNLLCTTHARQFNKNGELRTIKGLLTNKVQLQFNMPEATVAVEPNNKESIMQINETIKSETHKQELIALARANNLGWSLHGTSFTAMPKPIHTNPIIKENNNMDIFANNIITFLTQVTYQAHTNLWCAGAEMTDAQSFHFDSDTQIELDAITTFFDKMDKGTPTWANIVAIHGEAWLDFSNDDFSALVFEAEQTNPNKENIMDNDQELHCFICSEIIELNEDDDNDEDVDIYQGELVHKICSNYNQIMNNMDQVLMEEDNSEDAQRLEAEIAFATCIDIPEPEEFCATLVCNKGAMKYFIDFAMPVFFWTKMVKELTLDMAFDPNKKEFLVQIRYIKNSDGKVIVTKARYFTGHKAEWTTVPNQVKGFAPVLERIQLVKKA